MRNSFLLLSVVMLFSMSGVVNAEGGSGDGSGVPKESVGGGSSNSGGSNDATDIKVSGSSYWDSFNKNLVDPVCTYITKNPRPFKILGLSTGAAAATALAIHFSEKKINKKEAALCVWLATAVVSTGYYYGPDMLCFLKSCVTSS